jgi:uroporphyrinogen-III synthase
MQNVLIIRPQKEALSLAHSLKIRNIKSTLFPLFKPRFLPILDLGTPQAFIITSKNALYSLEGREDLKQIPLFVVGDQTAALAHDMGFTTVYKGSGTSQDLTGVILSHAHPKAGLLLHLSGEKVTGRLIEALREYGFDARRQIVYKIEDAPELPSQLIDSLHNKTLTHVMFFSPRTTMVFVNLLNKSKLERATSHMTSLCLSENVAEKARLIPWVKVWISSEPTAEAMIEHFDEKKE